MTSCRIHPGNVERRERAIDARIERKLECGGVGALRESLGVVANALVRVNALQKPGLASDEPDFRGGPVVGTQRVAKRVRPGHRYQLIDERACLPQMTVYPGFQRRRVGRDLPGV